MRSTAFDYAGYIPDNFDRHKRHYTFVLYDEDGVPYIGGADYLTDEDGTPYVEEMSYLSENNISMYEVDVADVVEVYPGDSIPTKIGTYWIDMADPKKTLYKVVG